MKLNLKSLKAKLYLGFILINALTLLLTVFMYYQIGQVPKQLKSTMNTDYSLEKDASSMRILLSDEVITLRAYLLYDDTKNKDQVKSLQTQADALQAKINNHHFPSDEAPLVKSANEKTKLWNSLLNDVVLPMAEQGKKQELLALIKKQYPTTASDAINAWNLLLDNKSGDLTSSLNSLMTNVNKVISTQLILCIVIILIATGISFYIAQAVTKPIFRIKNYIQKIGEGEISIDDLNIRSKDEFGDLANAINLMKGNLSTIVNELNDTKDKLLYSASHLTDNAKQTEEASAKVADSIQNVAQLSQSQAESSQEVATAMEEMAIGIQKIAENSTVVMEVANDVNGEVEEGNKMVQKAVQQIQFVYDTVQDSTQAVGELGALSKEIATIIDVIKGIAEMTNLLALNASIESARAGEHGKGFAVVAMEVKKLADQSKNSASQITKLIQTISEKMDSVVESMQKGNEEAKKGNELVSEVGETFQTISASIKNVTAQIEEVSASVQQMSAGAEEVTSSVEDMANNAKNITTHTSEVSTASESQKAQMDDLRKSAEDLNQLSSSVQEIVKQFK